MFSGMRYVYEVYKEKSFSKAAQNLFISQPSLSASIKKTEAKIGAPIFDRSTNPVHLTACGEEYIKCVERIMDIENSFADYLGNIDAMRAGKIVIGSSQFFVSFIIPSIISTYKEKYPLVDISIVEASSAALEEQLFNGTLDAAIDNNAFNEAIYERFLLRDEHLLLAVPADFAANAALKSHQLHTQDIIASKHLSPDCKPISLKPFAAENFILLGPGNDSRKRADRLFQKESITPKILLQLEQQFTAYLLANTGMGATFLTDSLVRRVRPTDRLVYYKLPETIAKQSLYCYYKRNKYITRALRKFLEIASASMD